MSVERITTQMVQRTTLADLNVAYNRMQNTQLELSSGKRINQPSDDPYGTSVALQLNGDLSGLGAYASNVQDGTAWNQAADTSLSNIENMVQRVRELVVQSANGSNSQANLGDAAAEIDQLTDAIKQEANTQYAGQYIFSGTATTTTPYTSATGDAFQGNTTAVNRQIGPGSSVQVSADLSSVLGSGPSAGDDKLLDTLRTISADLKSGTTTDINALSTTELSNLDGNMSQLQRVQAQVGSTSDRLSLAASRIQNLQDDDTEQLSNVQDADMAQTISDYSTEQAAYSAALRAGASIVQSSLLDFLK